MILIVIYSRVNNERLFSSTVVKQRLSYQTLSYFFQISSDDHSKNDNLWSTTVLIVTN